jgi:hypothetical protein
LRRRGVGKRTCGRRLTELSRRDEILVGDSWSRYPFQWWRFRRRAGRWFRGLCVPTDRRSLDVPFEDPDGAKRQHHEECQIHGLIASAHLRRVVFRPDQDRPWLGFEFSLLRVDFAAVGVRFAPLGLELAPLGVELARLGLVFASHGLVFALLGSEAIVELGLFTGLRVVLRAEVQFGTELPLPTEILFSLEW